ncbi:hypothetical protein Ddye_017440 [Dipteronia dyeriana]|uniref:Reverse transcriptase n=1 Tax=Dipteronia dyeriana TaxID=168575 RepID=A0AAD9X0I7_9ROSI|nr:hypothetical protein Ddye_017440 [Dipteronia dyeriana]
MGSTKAPGPEGFHAVFFKRFRSIIGEDVILVALKVLNGDQSIKDFNNTNVVLIPNKKNAEVMKDFRPISLCSVVYKIVTKCLANRLKIVIPFVTSPSQSAFVSGRLIFDNVLVSFEMLHSISHRKKGKKGFAAIKLDMSKAYDRVEWSFLGRELFELEDIQSHDKYLGLPTVVGKNRRKTFEEIKEKVWRRIKSWKGSLFSAGGKEILIKAVVQAVPTYLMSIFQLSQTLCQELNSMILQFLWVQMRKRREFIRETYSNPTDSYKWWMALWNLNIPPKVKMFIWRVCNDAFPSLINLGRRKVQVNLCCPLCKEDGESTFHAPFWCKEVVEIWENSDF